MTPTKNASGEGGVRVLRGAPLQGNIDLAGAKPASG